LFTTATGLTDIRTRIAHPESNDWVERLHRTHQEEGLIDAEMTEYGHTIDALPRWGHYYNYERPHASLAYLCPIDFYRGDPQARLAERERKLVGSRSTADLLEWRIGRPEPLTKLKAGLSNHILSRTKEQSDGKARA